MVYDPSTGRIMLFGGHGNEVIRNDLWAYDPSANTWTELHPTGDVPGYCEVMVYDSGAAKMIAIGSGGSRLWAYDSLGNAWTELHPTGDPPSDRSGYAAAYDPRTARVILFGGSHTEEWSEDNTEPTHTNPVSVWAYDSALNTWTKLSPAGDSPYGREDHAMVYHPGSGLILMFGGSWWDYNHMGEGEYPENLMAYDPYANTWTKLPHADRIPFGRAGHSMVYDWKTGKVVMFGGSDAAHGYLSGTWTLAP